MSTNDASDSMRFKDFDTATQDPEWQAAVKALLVDRKAEVVEGRAQLIDWEVVKQDICERVKSRRRRTT